MGNNLPPREGVWSARPKPVRRTLKKIPDWTAIPVLTATFSDTICQIFHLPFPSWIPLVRTIGFALLLTLFIIWKTNEVISRRTMNADLQFSDRPDGIVEYPIEVIILRDGKELGVDRGVAWFEEGLLHFTGAATSFVLAATDFWPRAKFDPFGQQAKGFLVLARPRFNTAIRLLPLTGLRGWSFRWTLRKFLRARKEVLKLRQWHPANQFGHELEHMRTSLTPEQIGHAAARDGVAQGIVFGPAE